MGIRGNEKADELAKNAQTQSVTRTVVRFSDFKPKVFKYVRNIWQEEWQTQAVPNKLFQICPNLNDPLPYGCFNRKEESVWCRLHVGHCYFSHSYILKGEDPPFCFACDERFTVQHVLVDCWDFYNSRKNFYSITDMRILSRVVPTDRIFVFLKRNWFIF